MLVFSALVCALVATALGGSPAGESSMEKLGVVPDVIDKVPEGVIQVDYPSGVSASNGNELTPTQVQNHPVLSWEAQADALYTLCLTDPDAPSRAEPKFREFLHYLVVNIPGKDIAKGNVLVDYIGSGPPKDTGLHRYVWLVFKQPTAIEVKDKTVSNKSRRNRPSFRIRKFAADNNLGTPVAGNFYQAQYDDYVPKLHAQLTEE